MKTKTTLILLTVFSLLTPLAYAFDIDGPTNFQGPGGGNVVFATFTSRQLSIVNAINRFTTTIFGGVGTGTVGFDCDTGDNMTIVTITPTSVSYTVTGAGDQRIYFQGYGKPTTITGGTVTLGAGDSLVVTTTGPRTVVLTWNTNFNNLVDDITGYLVVLALVPMVLAGGMIVLAMQTGEFTKEMFAVVISVTVGLYVLFLVWGSMIAV